jgi:hypothetical protein
MKHQYQWVSICVRRVISFRDEHSKILNEIYAAFQMPLRIAVGIPASLVEIGPSTGTSRASFIERTGLNGIPSDRNARILSVKGNELCKKKHENKNLFHRFREIGLKRTINGKIEHKVNYLTSVIFRLKNSDLGEAL